VIAGGFFVLSKLRSKTACPAGVFLILRNVIAAIFQELIILPLSGNKLLTKIELA
jgi:hypothetical protein